MPAERGAQFSRAAIGIAVDLAGQSAISGDRLGARPERALVRRQADRALDPGRRRLAADIGSDIEDARPGDRGGRGRHRLNLLLWRRYRPMPETPRTAGPTARPPTAAPHTRRTPTADRGPARAVRAGARGADRKPAQTRRSRSACSPPRHARRTP